MQRTNQAILILSFIPFCWLAMMAMHELGHILAAWITGGHVTQVVLYPLDFSRTDVSPNPMPLCVAWSGPIMGVGLPLCIWGIFWGWSLPGDYLTRFLAGFCLIANGAYIGFGSFGKIGDAGDMIRLHAERWPLWIFGLITIPIGFWLWHGLGPRFGLGESKGQVEPWAAHLSLGLFVVTFLATFFLSPRF